MARTPLPVRKQMSAFARQEPGLLALGGVIGILTGVLAFLLVQVIGLVRMVTFGSTPSTVTTVLAPTAGALLVGVLVTYWIPEVAGGGIVEVMRTMALRGGRFRKRVPLGMLTASGLALGTGGSGGREAPIVLGGGAVGSLMGTLFRVDEDRMRTLVAAGAAAGIGASFNAPIGGMMFAIELILGRLSARSLQVVVLAAVAGSVTARELVGPEIVFESRVEYGLTDPRELLGYALVGVLAALVGIAFLHGERIGHQLFDRLRVWRPLRVALGGLGVGLIALAVPEGATLTSVRRGGQVIVPRGETVLQAGDEVVALTDIDHRDTLRAVRRLRSRVWLARSVLPLAVFWDRLRVVKLAVSR